MPTTYSAVPQPEKLTCTRRLQWCMGHRIIGHEGKCRNLHGHNYVAYFEAEMMQPVFAFTDRGSQDVYRWPDGREERVPEGTKLSTGATDSLGRVIDFSVLKSEIGDWIDECWDHGFLLSQADGAGIAAMNAFGESNGRPQKVSFLKENPTAENIAAHLLLEVCPMVLAGTGVRVTHVTVWETENCSAEASL